MDLIPPRYSLKYAYIGAFVKVNNTSDKITY
jgi:hypothetical protein